jgi:hypothetical protein
MSKKILLKVTDSVRILPTRKDPSKTVGFQKCGLSDDLGMYESFERMFSPDRNEKALPPGDYEAVNFRGYIDRDGRFQVGHDLVPVQAAK